MTEVLDEEYWDINGTSLHRAGWSVATLPGLDLPPLRGQDVVSGSRPGAAYAEKVPDSRVVPLSIWTTASNPATGAFNNDYRLAINDNIRTLQRLFRPPGGGQVSLTRRRVLTVNSVRTVVASTALAECMSLSPSMTGRARAEINAEMLLAVPYFFGTEVEYSGIAVSTPQVINNPGDDTAGWFNFEVDFVGPLTNPRLTVVSGSFTTWVQYTAVISAGQTVTLDCEAFTAKRGTANVITYVSHAGKPYWLGLYPGNNTVTLTASAGTGTAAIRYMPPYF